MLRAVVLHTADISNLSKPFQTSLQWTDRILREFFQQGDREKQLGLPISPLCDREMTDVPSSQLGFIDFIVQPTLTELAVLAPKVEYLCLQRMRTNKEMWLRRQRDCEASSDPDDYSIECWAVLDVENVEYVAEAKMSVKVGEAVGTYIAKKESSLQSVEALLP